MIDNFKIEYKITYSNGVCEYIKKDGWLEFVRSPKFKSSGSFMVFYKDSSYNYRCWYKDGKFHRTDGPEQEHSDNIKPIWCINGDNITNQVYDWFKEMNWDYYAGLDTDEKKLLFRLKFV